MPKKNIVLLVADDLGKYLGCYGETSIKTPHIDKLAAQGTRFDMAFTSTASCSASRSVIYTGLHTHENGTYGLQNGWNHFMTFDSIQTAPKAFNDLGYLTGIVGKVHVGPDNVYPYQVREESTTRNVSWIADRGAAFFERAKVEDKPFFLTVGWIDPHRDLTRKGFGNTEDNGQVVNPITYARDEVVVPDWLTDLPEVREELVEYYESISRMDQGVGFVLDHLEKQGLADDTLVVFLSDNGAPFINSKTTLYDAGVRLPLVVRKPGAAAGVENPNMVSYIDILPTFLDWAGHPEVKATRIGRSFLPILESKSEEQSWDLVFGSHSFHEITNYWPTRFMRTKRYKYHRNVAWKLDFPFAADIYGSLTWEGHRNHTPGMVGKRSLKSYLERPPEELYDLDKDPDEVVNLADKPEHQETLRSMRETTEQWQRQTEDPWLYRDGVSLKFIRHHMEQGLKVPDRFDIDMNNLGNRTGPLI